MNLELCIKDLLDFKIKTFLYIINRLWVYSIKLDKGKKGSFVEGKEYIIQGGLNFPTKGRTLYLGFKLIHSTFNFGQLIL